MQNHLDGSVEQKGSGDGVNQENAVGALQESAPGLPAPHQVRRNDLASMIQSQANPEIASSSVNNLENETPVFAAPSVSVQNLAEPSLENENGAQLVSN